MPDSLKEQLKITAQEQREVLKKGKEPPKERARRSKAPTAVGDGDAAAQTPRRTVGAKAVRRAKGSTVGEPRPYSPVQLVKPGSCGLAETS